MDDVFTEGNHRPAASDSESGAVIVRLKSVRKLYKTVIAVDRIDLSIMRGEFFTLLGPSGSGKTTTLRLIAGFERPDEGVIELDGCDVTGRAPFDRDVNTVFQDYALFPHMTVAENIAYGVEAKGVPKAERAARVDEALQMVHLDAFSARKPAQLSGGQRQRVALARAIVNRPAVLLLDEPLGALDLKLRQSMEIELKRIQEQVGITFIYVTHDQEEALTMSDRIAVFRDGLIVQVGTPEEVYEHPVNEFVAGFVGASNILNRDGRRILIRPEKIVLDAPAIEGAEQEGVHVERGRIGAVVYVGMLTRCSVVLDDGATITAVVLNGDGPAGSRRFEPGDPVTVAWRKRYALKLD